MAIDTQRYARQLQLKEIGEAGQARLQRSRALVVGLGGLGSPAALYLAAAGLGTLGLCDPDTVAISNLQRQILYRADQVGLAKAPTAAASLVGLNPELRVETKAYRFAADNAAATVAGYDVVLDALDNFADRYLLHETCYRAGIPVVSAAVGGWDGLLLTVSGEGPCYRCFFPEPPEPESLGILGAVAGTMGVLQALAAIRLLLGIGPSPVGRLLTFNGLEGRFREVRWPKDPTCPVCGDGGAKGLSCLADRSETL